MTNEYSRRQEIAVGLFVLAAIAGLVFLSFRIGGGKPAAAASYDLIFDSALGLQRDNVVTVAGVRVGLVDAISVDNGRARVRVAVEPGLVLYPDASAAVRARTLLGEKYVDLVPGKGPGEPLRSGAVIDHTVPTIEIDQVIRGAEEVISRANRILPTFQAAVEKIDGLVRRSDVDATAKSLGDVLDEVARLVKSLGDLTKASGEDARVLLAELRQRSPQVLDRIEQTADRIDKLAAAVPTEEMADAIKRAPQAVGNADKALADLRVAVADLRRIAQQGTAIASSLEKLLARAESVDERSIREFMQVQGVRVNLTTDPTILRRIRELKNRELPAPLPGEEGAASVPAPLSE